MSTVLVTGGAGFIGANLCKRLQECFDKVLVLDDLSTGFAKNLDGLDSDVVELVEGSILDEPLLRRLVANTKAIVHLAARPSVARSVDDPRRTHRINVDGTLNVLEVARAQSTPPHIIFASSSSVYGANPELPKHEGLATRPRSPYAASKLTGEAYVLAYQESYGMPATSFRFFNVFGPMQRAGHAYAAVIPAFIDAALRGEPLPIQGDGVQTRDFTYVHTVTEVLARTALFTRTSPGPVNLAYGTRTSINALSSLIAEIVGKDLEVHHFPTRAGDVRDSQAANDVLLKLFPDVRPVALRVGLGETIEWFLSGKLS